MKINFSTLKEQKQWIKDSYLMVSSKGNNYKIKDKVLKEYLGLDGEPSPSPEVGDTLYTADGILDPVHSAGRKVDLNNSKVDDGDIELNYYEPWNAHNIYFYDHENNILEFIALRDESLP